MKILGLLINGASLVAVIVVGCYSVLLGRRAAVAAEKSSEASVRAAALAALDANYRRAEALLDVVLEMRELLNSQNRSGEDQTEGGRLQRGSGGMLQRIALRRKLEGRLVPFETEASNWIWVQNLKGGGDDWNTSVLEAAILEVKLLLKSVADEQNS